MAEPLRATFFALRKREPRGVLGRAVLVHAVLSAAAWLVLFAIVAALTDNDETSPTAALVLVGFLLGCVLTHALIVASFEAACLNRMIHGACEGFGGFSLGAPTWRVFSGYLLWGALSIAALVLAGVLSNSLTYLNFYFDAGLLGRFGPMTPWALVVLAWLVLGPRFAPAAALGISRGKFAFFNAWAVLRGRALALLRPLLFHTFVAIALGVGAYYANAAIFSNVSQPESDKIAVLAVGVSLATTAVTAPLGWFIFFSAGVNARAVIAAIDEGKIEGVSPNVADVFD